MVNPSFSKGFRGIEKMEAERDRYEKNTNGSGKHRKKNLTNTKVTRPDKPQHTENLFCNARSQKKLTVNVGGFSKRSKPVVRLVYLLCDETVAVTRSVAQMVVAQKVKAKKGKRKRDKQKRENGETKQKTGRR